MNTPFEAPIFLAAGTLVLPPHARLREELLNLVYEVGAQGVRVLDKGKVHQDHAVAVRGVVAQLGVAVAVPVGSANLAAEPYQYVNWDAGPP